MHTKTSKDKTKNIQNVMRKNFIIAFQSIYQFVQNKVLNFIDIKEQKTISFTKLIYHNKYKFVMQEKITNSCEYARNIGKSNDLQNIVCTTSRDMRVSYSQEKHFSRENYHINEKNKLTISNQDTAQKFNRTIQAKSARSRSQRKNLQPQKINDQCENENQEYFWPIDIVQDQTGNALRQLKSYIQTHKVNTYIKLVLTQTQKSSKILNQTKSLIKIIQKLIIKTKQQPFNKIKQINQKSKISYQKTTNLPLSSLTSNFDKSSPQQFDKLHLKNYQNKSSCTRSKRSQSQNNIKSTGSQNNRVIRIDYQVITIPKNKSNKSSRIIYYQNPTKPYPHPQPQIQQLSPQTQQFIRSNSNYNLQPQPSSSIQQFFASNSLIKHKTLDIHQKQYLTPNTSTYFNTISQGDKTNSEYIRSNKTGSRSKNKSKRFVKDGYRQGQRRINSKDNQQSGYEQEYQYNSNNQEQIPNTRNNNKNINININQAKAAHNKNMIDKIYRNKLIQINYNPNIYEYNNVNEQSMKPNVKKSIIGLSNNLSA